MTPMTASTRTHLSPALKQATPVVVDYAAGSWIYGTDGNRYLDFTTGIGVTSTGHCHPRVVEAAREQVGKIIHAQYTTVMHTPLLELTEKLGDFLHRIFCVFGEQTEVSRCRRPSVAIVLVLMMLAFLGPVEIGRFFDDFRLSEQLNRYCPKWLHESTSH